MCEGEEKETRGSEKGDLSSRPGVLRNSDWLTERQSGASTGFGGCRFFSHRSGADVGLEIMDP